MGTSYTVKLIDVPASYNQDQLRSGIESALQAVDSLMSTYKSDSEISRFNQLEETEWFDISESTFEVLETALEISEHTGGAFDITIEPLVDVWGFGSKQRPDIIPTDTEISRGLENVGYSWLSLRKYPPAIRKSRPQISVDVSAIAKGFAVDQIADYLFDQKIGNYMIEVGGEVRVAGNKAQQKPWRIAIEKPLTMSRSVQTVLDLKDIAVATSGDYRNYFEENNIRYSHTLDPRTGRPIQHNLASVTILDPSCMRADAWATAIMVLGPEKGYALARKNGLAAYFILRTGDTFSVRQTEGFNRF